MNQAEPIVLTVAILAILIALYCQALMRSIVNEQLQPEVRFSWWSSNFSTNKKLYQKYRDLYPKSHLALICHCALWIGLIGMVFERIWK
jgi:hypothetical protein